MKRALFPGSFDPFTLGHEDIATRASKLFDEVIIGVGVNTTKQHFYSVEKRIELISNIFKNQKNIKIIQFEGLTVNCCKQLQCGFIIRGIRNHIDFEYEKSIAEMNKQMNPLIETVFLNCMPQYAAISSTIVREIIKSGGNAGLFLNDVIATNISKYEH
jgi:pantetheine-phosphate adenylyltransferase